MADREPIDATSRRTGEMPADPNLRGATPHATHDLVLLAAVADRDPDPPTEATVRQMVADCSECAAIADELRALAAGLADLPPTLAVPRDMRLTATDAARLRRGGTLRRFLRPLGLAGMPGLQPLAGALTALGIAGLLLANIPLGLSAGAGAALDQRGSAVSGYASGPQDSESKAMAPAQATASPEDAGGPASQSSSAPPPVAASSAPGASPGDIAFGGQPSGRAAEPTAHSYAPTIASEANTGPSIPPLTLISIVLVVVGVVLLALRAVARRVD